MADAIKGTTTVARLARIADEIRAESIAQYEYDEHEYEILSSGISERLLTLPTASVPSSEAGASDAATAAVLDSSLMVTCRHYTQQYALTQAALHSTAQDDKSWHLGMRHRPTSSD